MKTCSKCLLEKPSDTHHFPPRRDSVDGLNTRCRQCEAIRRETSRKRLIGQRQETLTRPPVAKENPPNFTSHSQFANAERPSPGATNFSEISSSVTASYAGDSTENFRETSAAAEHSGEVPFFAPLPRLDKATVLCIPDIHFPWHSERGLQLLYELAAVGQPDLIIQLGDLYDLLAFSRFSRSHNLYTPAEELDSARRLAVSMWRHLGDLCPKARRVQIRGNHDDRASKRVAEVLPEIEHLVTPAISALFRFDGVETYQNSRIEYEFEGVLYQHGHMPGGRHFLHNMQNTVTGHTHKGATWYKPLENHMIWELNAGFLGDHSAPVFSYHAQARLHGTTLGCGWIDQYGPRFIPFE